MGNQQSNNINILVQDDEFDDMFTKYYLSKTSPGIKWLEYIVGGSEKFEGMALSAKISLADSMGYDRSLIPRLTTNGNGKIKSNDDDFETFINTVRKDLKPYSTTDGFNIQIILTGQCAPFVEIMSKFLIATDEKEAYLSPTNIEIVVVNGKHNGKGLFKSLYELTNICDVHNIELVIHEFNAFSSMGEGATHWVDFGDERKFIECGTSDTFNKRIYEEALNRNKFAIGIVQYGVKFNSSLVGKSVEHIDNAVKTLTKINPKESNIYGLQYLHENVVSYISNLITNGEFLRLDIKLCQRLSDDLSKVLNCTNSVLNIVDDDLKSTKITNVQANNYKKKLYRIRGWFKSKVAITKSNMIHFPFHDLSAFLITSRSDTLQPVDAWAVKYGEFMNIVKDKPMVDSFQVIHYVAHNPELTRSVIEELLVNAITSK